MPTQKETAVFDEQAKIQQLKAELAKHTEGQTPSKELQTLVGELAAVWGT